ncbi:MAG: hypothetical protein KHW87_08695 [Clostridiales bacterium]|nr:hypothetical protein [Clostridiales bacterium]
MNYISEIFTRADIQQIREFLLHGTEENRVDPRTYKERIESAHKAFSTRLHRDYPDEKEFEEITQPIYDYVNAVEEVYMEIGLQVGAILAAQTTQNLKAALERE